MIVIPLGAMTVPPRQRSQIATKELNDLAESISRIGLLHPIVVRPLGTPEAPIYQLVCGQRRMEAVKIIQSVDGISFRCNAIDIPPGYIAATLLSELDDVSRMEAELEENLLRVDLHWRDKEVAIVQLHTLRKTQNPEQTQQDTAEELAKVRGTSVPAAAASISRAKVIAQHKDSPLVTGARNANEAYQNITREQQAKFEVKLAELTGFVSKHTLIVGDAMQEMAKLPTEHFDCIIADPPYGVGADEFGDAGPAHSYADSPETAEFLGMYILGRGMYIAKPSAHLYMFCDIELFKTLRHAAEQHGWNVQRTPIIWYKGLGFDPYPGIGFRRSYEMLLYCWKGNKPHRSLMEDVLAIRGERKEGHAASKPVDLYRRLLSRSCIAGDAVLDPCCGAGTIFEAATSLQLEATGIEIDESFATLAKARMIIDV